MNLNSQLARRIVTEKQLEDLEKALSKDKHIIPFVLKVLHQRVERTKPAIQDLDKPNWEFRRAHLDGRAHELLWLIEFLTKGAADE